MSHSSLSPPDLPEAEHRKADRPRLSHRPDPEVAAAGDNSVWDDGMGRTAVRSLQALLLLAVVAIIVVVMVRLRLVVVPTLIAILVAAAVSPLVRILSSRGVPRGLAAWIALLTGLGVLGLVGWAVVAGVQGEWDELRDSAIEGLAELRDFLVSGPLPIDAQQIDQAQTAAVDALSGSAVRTGAVEGAVVAAEVVAGMFLAVVVLFFLLKDGPKIWQFFLRPLSGDRLVRMERVGERGVDVLGGYVRGTAIVALVDAVIIGVALVILGVPLALPLALIVFLGAFIPLVGATVAGALAALVALVANGPFTALIVLGVVIAVNQIEGDVLAPIVLGRAVALHPLAILLALTAGAILAGVIGALLSVPLAAVVWSAVRAWNDDDEGSAAQDPARGSPVEPAKAGSDG